MAHTHSHFKLDMADSRESGVARTINWMATSDPSRMRFESMVLRATQNWFVLDSTWLEPDRNDAFGDRGWVLADGFEFPIVRVDGDGAHHVRMASAVAAGDRVEISIDGELRHRRMRTVALQNLVRSVLGPEGHWRPTHRTATQTTLQQGWSGAAPCIDRVQEQLECLIRERHRIWRVIDEADGGVYWQIDGVATIADEALSVSDTSAIGPFSLRLADSAGRVCIFAETLPM